MIFQKKQTAESEILELVKDLKHTPSGGEPGITAVEFQRQELAQRVIDHIRKIWGNGFTDNNYIHIYDLVIQQEIPYSTNGGEPMDH